MAADYETLLDNAIENVQQQEKCERFEIIKAEGHHEGNRTIISNFIQIAGCIRRKPEEIAKFLFKELATSGEMAGDRLILTRKVSSQNINQKIEKYVKQYVICNNCSKPDTEIVEENGKKYIRCLACGNQKQIA